MISRQAPKTVFNGPDLTALIDIIFIVIVFLLLTANTQLLPLPIDVPNSDEASNTAPEPGAITVSIQAEAPVWAIDTQRFDNWEAFQSALVARLDSNSKITIAADQATTVVPLMKLLSLLQKHNIPSTQLLMEAPAL